MTPAANTATAQMRWYLVRAKPRGEPVAKLHLERQGYGAYLPLAMRLARCRGRVRDRIEPLFPRYLFARVDCTRQALAPVRSTQGVSEIVRFGERYAVIPDRMVSDLMACADRDSGLHVLREPPLERGAMVRVSGGVFDGLEGVFERYDGEQRVLILLAVLGRQTPIRMQAYQVSASAGG